MRTLGLFAIVCLVFAVVPVHSIPMHAMQPTEPPPPVEPGRMEAQLGGAYTSLDLSQTINGVTVMLGWGYADPWLIEVGMLKRGGGPIRSAVLRLHDETHPTPDLGDGYIHPDATWFQWGPARAISAAAFDPNHGQMPFYDHYDTFPETLDLELVVLVEMPPVSPTPDPNAPTLAPEVTPEPTPILTPVYQEFRFEFTLKVYPVRILQPDAVLDVDGLTVSINRMAITPVITILDMCYSVESEIDGWYMAETDTYYGENEETIYERNGIPFDRFEGPDADGCGYYIAPLFYDLVSSPFTLEIGHLKTVFRHSDRDLREIQSYLKLKGLDMMLEVDTSGSIRGFRMPEGVMLEDVAYELGMIHRIEGPWQLTVPIPQE